MTFSGPILATTHVDYVTLHASGNRVSTSSGETVTRLSPSTIVHNIRVVDDYIIVNGGREVVVLKRKSLEELVRVFCNDWVLSTTIASDLLCCVVMHNRVEIFSLVNGSVLGTVACPTHALLYSAEIRPTDQPHHFQVFGGGVLSSLYHWEFTFSDTRSYVVLSQQYNTHKGSIFRIRANRDELLTTSDDRNVILWKIQNGVLSPVRTFSSHLARVWDAIWFGDFIVTGCEDSFVRYFDREGKCVHKFCGHSRDVRCLTVSVDGILSGGEDGCLRSWTPTTPNEFVWDIPDPGKDWIRHVELFKYGFVAVTALGIVYKDERAIKPPSPLTTTCAKIVSDKLLVLGLASGGIAMVDLQRMEFVSFVDSVVPQRVCSVFTFERYRDHIIVANHAGFIAIVNVTSGELVCQISCESNVKVGNILCVLQEPSSVVLGDDKGTLVRVSKSTDGSFTTRSCRIIHGEKIISVVAFGEIFLKATTSEGNTITVSSDTLERVLAIPIQKHRRINYLCEEIWDWSWGFTGEDLLVVDSQDVVQWSYKCGGHRRPFDFDVWPEGFRFIHASNHRVTIAEIRPLSWNVVSGYCGDLVHAIVRKDHLVFTGCEDNVLRRIDLRVGKDKLMTTRVHEGSVRALCMIAGKSLLVSGGSRSQAFLHHLDDVGKIFQSELISWSGSSKSCDDVRVMGIAATSNTVCLVDSTAKIHLWDISLKSVTKSLSVSEIEISVCLSAATDGSCFFVGAGNGFVVALTADGTVLGAERIHQNGVNAIACLGSAGLMVSVSDDQSMAVWRWGEEVEVLCTVPDASTCSIRAVAVNGSTIATTGTDRRITLWNFDGLTVKRERMIPTAVTDPLAIVITDKEAIVAGRGIESISLVM